MHKFHDTRMGNKFYEGTMPRIAYSLQRIADSLENNNIILEDNRWTKLKEKINKEISTNNPQTIELSTLLVWMNEIEIEG